MSKGNVVEKDNRVESVETPSSDEGRTMKKATFKIQQMTSPANAWIWSAWDAEGNYVTDLGKGSYKSAEDAARAICGILKLVGANPSKVDIWIERKVRSRWTCQK